MISTEIERSSEQRGYAMSESKPHNSVFEPPAPRPAGERLYWTRLHGSAKALAVSRLAQRWNGLVVVIAKNALHAERLEEELGFFSGGGQAAGILNFPDWETLPYDRFSPYQDIVSQRLETLARLPQLRAGYLITSVATLMHRLAPREYLEANTLVLKVGERLDRERFRERLIHGGYRCVSQVLEHGDFAVRGSLLDVYPMGSRLPYRIDWFDELIDTLRLFDPETQRSIESSDRIEVL
ncbi:MAG: transcription-repair coupling factor, partial [Gammaproteobacteria bacterium]